MPRTKYIPFDPWAQEIPAELPRRNTSAGSQIRNGRYLLHSRKELAQYQEFPKIYGEMKFAKDFTKLPFRFLDLPAELRNTIYELLFISPNPIEIWPETGEDLYDVRLREATIRSYQKQIKGRVLPLCLMRTCKQIHSEVAPLYYGHNEFRFSGVNGTAVACAFISTLGVRQSRFLKSITIPMPFWIRNRHSVFALSNQIDSISSSGKLLAAIPFSLPRVKNIRHYEVSCITLLKMLRKTDIENLKLVLPEWYRYIGGAQELIWTALADMIRSKPSLKVEIVYLCHIAADGGYAMDRWNKRLVQKLQTLCSCDIKLGFYEPEGRWKVAGTIDDLHPDYLLEDIRNLFIA